MVDTGTPASRPPDWTTWFIVVIVLLLAIVAFVLLASTYFPIT
jgi:hypothetical protein